MKKPKYEDGDRAAIAYDNYIERNASERRWDAFYKGCTDARNHKAYNPINYINENERIMYKLGWENIKRKKIK